MPVRRGKLIIEADVTDWDEEVKREEAHLETEQDVCDAILSGQTTAKVAAHALAGRELGMFETRWGLPLPKTALLAGAQVAVSGVVASQKREARHGGKVREIVMPVRDGDDESAEPPAHIDDDRAMGLALNYLYRHVPGYIRGRLAIVAEKGGDVRECGERLKGIIDEMVIELTREG